MHPAAFASAHRATTPGERTRTHVRSRAFTKRSNAFPRCIFFVGNARAAAPGRRASPVCGTGSPGSRSAPFPVAVPGPGGLTRGWGGVPKCRFLPVAVRTLDGVRRVALQPEVPQRCAGGEGQRAIPGAPRMLGQANAGPESPGSRSAPLPVAVPCAGWADAVPGETQSRECAPTFGGSVGSAGSAVCGGFRPATE